MLKILLGAALFLIGMGVGVCLMAIIVLEKSRLGEDNTDE